MSEVLSLTGRQMTHLRRTPEKIIAVSLTPVAMVVILGYLFASVITVEGGAYHDYVMAGVFAQVGLACVGSTAIGVASDLQTGLTDRFRSMPISRASVLFAYTVADLVTAVAAMGAVSGVGLLVGWRIHGGLLESLAAVGLLLGFTYTMLWLGVLIGLVMRNLEAINGVTALALVVFSFLSNSFMPLRGLPGWLRTVAEWNPVSSVAEACRVLWHNAPASEGASLPVRHPELASVLTLAVLLAVVVPLALRAFRTAATR
ncbi:ABC transporter permease [Streptomyces aurantiogriseus]|uniref:Transport permease protein n=1 Tax=Streptomyces aurantiogriseus TaxID=66870 RepID=A0A918F546_9ACTN|nr:ABC transporter permease [Streptomyces aurantiogriseus]GGR05382.1 transport permease protein [Streptomyces aurantiogriseus]